MGKLQQLKGKKRYDRLDTFIWKLESEFFSKLQEIESKGEALDIEELYQEKELQSFIKHLKELECNAEGNIKELISFLAGFKNIKNYVKKSYLIENEELIEKGYHSVPLSQAGIPFEICEYEKNLFMHTQGSKWYKAIKSLTSWLMPAKGMTTVPMFLPSVGCFYRKKYAQNYDSSSERVYVTSRDYRQCLGVLRALFKMLMQINKTFDSVKKDWRVRYPQLITADYWKEKLQVIEESIR